MKKENKTDAVQAQTEVQNYEIEVSSSTTQTLGRRQFFPAIDGKTEFFYTRNLSEALNWDKLPAEMKQATRIIAFEQMAVKLNDMPTGYHIKKVRQLRPNNFIANGTLRKEFDLIVDAIYES